MRPPAPPERGELRLQDVEVTYPGTVPVRALKPTNVVIGAGEFVTIVGRSGSGKSTLLNVLGLLDRPTAGRYWVRGYDTSTLTEADRTALRGQHFGFVFQSYHLLPERTAVENAALALVYRHVPRRQRHEYASDALNRVGLTYRMHALPGTLSGGERQRVAIARALAQQPRVLLCDEPTGNLDRRNADAVMNLLRTLNADGLTIVIVTHDDTIAATAARRIVIDDGIVTDSAAAQPALLALPGVGT